jgi:hypothetical protein
MECSLLLNGVALVRLSETYSQDLVKLWRKRLEHRATVLVPISRKFTCSDVFFVRLGANMEVWNCQFFLQYLSWILLARPDPELLVLGALCTIVIL